MIRKILPLLMVLAAAISASAQSQTAYFLRSTEGAANASQMQYDVQGRLYLAVGNQVIRVNTKTRLRDTVYRHNNSRPISGFCLGENDTTAYFTVSDSLFKLDLNSKRMVSIFSSYEYPTTIAFNKKDSMIYAIETGFDNARNAAIGAYSVKTGTRRFVAGVNYRGGANPLAYVNDTGSKARFSFARPGNGGRPSVGSALAWLSEDTLLIGDNPNWCVRWLNVRNGVVGTFAGALPGATSARSFKDTTARYGARFYSIYGLEVDSKGFVYVLDAGEFNDNGTHPGNRVRKIAPNGTVYTLAGNGLGQGTGAFNNLDFIPGIGTAAMIGRGRAMAFNTAKDTLYVGLSLQAIKMYKRPQRINLILPDREVGSGRNLLVGNTSANLKLSFTLISAPSNVSMSGDTIIIPDTANTGVVKVIAHSDGDDDNWSAVSDTLEFGIKKGQSIVLRKVSDKTFGDTTFVLYDSVAVSSGFPLKGRLISVVPANCASLDSLTGLVTINAAGTVVYRVWQAGNDTLLRVEVQDTFVINKADQIIAFDTITDKTFGDAAFTISAASIFKNKNRATALPITFSLVNTPSSVATLNNVTRTITIVGAGQATVRAVQLGNNNFNAAVFAERSFTINKRVQVVTFDSVPDRMVGSGVYNFAARSATPNSGLPLTFTSIQAPNNVTVLNTPGRVNVPANADTGLVIVKVKQNGNTNHLADSALRAFKIVANTSGSFRTLELAKLSVYPNPAIDLITIQQAILGTATFVVYDSRGSIVLKKSMTDGETPQLKVSGLNQGVYLLIANINGKLYQASFVKN